MTRMRYITTAGLLITFASLAHAQDETTRPVKPDEIYKAPDQPLDKRINAEKVTECDPPPLPERVVLPMPPVHKISERAEDVPISAAHYQRAKTALHKGLDFLRTNQEKNGGWLTKTMAAPTDQPDKPSPVGVAVTALAVKALAQADPNDTDHVIIRNALQLIMTAQSEDGSFEGGALANYVTSSVLQALATVKDNDFRDQFTQTIEWIQINQWDQTEGLNARQDWFGGAGYGNHRRPDVSNTQMMLDAMYDAGLSPDEPAFQKALAFISRAQNLKATNNASWTSNDGGFIYTPANDGESMASEAVGEGRYGELISAGQPRSLRSYGSMTYAGFKSMIYAGLSQNDVRVRAAFDWIRNNWTFEENPGLGQQGLFYYYHTMSRALRIAQQHKITDVDGETHNWREELIDAIVERQSEDGSWVNEADRWLEGEPIMCTIYSTLALEEAIKPVMQTE